MNKNKIYVFISIMLLFALACDPPEKEYVAPKIWTMQPIEITTTEATFRATFTKGSEEISIFGFEWKETLEDDRKEVYAEAYSGSYTYSVTHLKEDVQYTVKAFIIDALGNKYFGEEESFFTHGTVTDIDGNVYLTLRYGNKVWMTENLRVTRFAEGTPLEGRSGGPCLETDGPTYYYSGDHTPYFQEPNFGLLYNAAAIGSAPLFSYTQGPCPDGWHVAYMSEWMELINYCGGKTAGTTMKTKTWIELGYSGGNSSRFSIEPAGYYFYNSEESFRSVFYGAYFWTQTDNVIVLIHNSPEFHVIKLGDSGRSIRCVQN